jgi:hypothetical protein
MRSFHLGLDLDNTIISYDKAFVDVGTELGMLPAGHRLATKDEVKSDLFVRSGDELKWMELQGQVYGRYIDRAELFVGVADCLRRVQQQGGRISIVSHKTRYGHFDAARVNLWDAALGWMERRRFFEADGLRLNRRNVHFSESREGKIAAIAAIGCQAFVDDLPDVLLHRDFPSGIERIWFAADKPAAEGSPLEPHRNWSEVGRAIQALQSAA